MRKNVTFELGGLEQTYGKTEDIKVIPSVSGITGKDYEITYNQSSVRPENAGRYKVRVNITNPNYKGSAADTLVISKAQPRGEIVMNKQSYVYGDSVSAEVINAPEGISPIITYAGTGIYVPRSEPPENAGNYTVIAEIGDENHETITVTKNFRIEKAKLTVRAKNASRAYGEANPVFELEYSGFINGENKNVLLYEPAAAANANASSGVGIYKINVSGGYAENYEFVYDNGGELEITGAAGGELYITGSADSVYAGSVFALHAFFGNTKVNVKWESSDEEVAEIKPDGTVTAKKAGEALITATADGNYGGAKATFRLKVKQTGIILVPTDRVKIYNGKRQDISFEPSGDFVPVISGEGKNVEVKYTLISDPSVTEPVRAGVYSVDYKITGEKYTGGGNATLYINKAEVKVKPLDVIKEYGDEADGFGIEFVNPESAEFADIDEIKALASFESDGAAKEAKASENGYDITVSLSKAETENLVLSVEGKGKLKVKKAPLKISVKNITREYGAENPALEAEYEGFKNGETKDVLSGELILAYSESINDKTAVGKYEKVLTAKGLNSDNYDITYAGGDAEITKMKVSLSAGDAKSSYVIINFDKAVPNLAAENFVIKDGENPVLLTGITPSADNMAYTLNGSFSVGTTYEITVQLASETQEIIGSPVSVTPSRSSGGSGGGNGGGGGSKGGGSSAAVSKVKVTFETNGGSAAKSVEVEKNKTVSEPEAPSKEGYVFGGWYADRELKTKYDFSEKVTKDIVLYAAWTEKTSDGGKDGETGGDKRENPFKDVKAEDWFGRYVEYVSEKGLMNGTDGENFEPEGALSRAMLVTVIWRAENKPQSNNVICFSDVDLNGYYAEAVRWAVSAGIVKGVSETEFAPNESITREQMAAIIFRYAKYKGIAPEGEWAIRLDYADLGEIYDYAAEAVMYCRLKEIMQGRDGNRFAPKENATRAETAAIIQRLLETK